MVLFGAHNYSRRENIALPLSAKLAVSGKPAPSRLAFQRKRAVRIQNVAEAARRYEKSASPSPVSISIVVPDRTRTARKPTQETTTDGDVSMMNLDDAVSATSSKTRPLTLPRCLYRPAFREPSRVTLTKVEAMWADIPLSYLHDGLLGNSVPLLAALSASSCEPARDKLTKTVNVHIAHYTANPPTHMLAIHGGARVSASEAKKITLFPIHTAVIAAHCANLPALPPSQPVLSAEDDDAEDGYDIDLPVVPLGLPHPPSFPLLQTFLYTKNVSAVFASLLPSLPPLQPDETLQESMPAEELIKLLSSTYTQKHLLSHLATVSGLWRNACALGLGYGCEGLYDGVERAWEILLGALALAQRA